jgi:hypothetical protein
VQQQSLQLLLLGRSCWPRGGGCDETMPPLDVAVTKGPGGYGMNISENGIVTSFSGDDSAAKLAGVPIKSRIVRFAKLC